MKLEDFIMIDNFIEYITHKILIAILTDEDIDRKTDKYVILRYSIYNIINEIFKIVIFFFIFEIFGYSKEFCYAITIMISIRAFNGGIHKKSNFECFCYSLFILTLVILFGELIEIGFFTKIFITMLFIMIIICYAPVISKKRANYPLNKKKEMKRMSVCIVLIWFMVSLFSVNKIASIIYLCEVIEMIEILYVAKFGKEGRESGYKSNIN